MKNLGRNIFLLAATTTLLLTILGGASTFSAVGGWICAIFWCLEASR